MQLTDLLGKTLTGGGVGALTLKWFSEHDGQERGRRAWIGAFGRSDY